ncbi:hypothetical protein ACFL00_02120 [Pseudomonadota bacterium]
MENTSLSEQINEAELSRLTGFRVREGAYKRHSPKSWFGATIRGIDIEINTSVYRINKLSEEQHGVAQNLVVDNDFVILQKSRQRLIIERKECLIEGYKHLLTLVEDSEELTNHVPEIPYLADQIVQAGESKFFSAAFVIDLLVSNRVGHVIRKKNREILYSDSQDRAITRGRSVKLSKEQFKNGNYWREHVVPCKLIAERAAEMSNDNREVREIAKFIEYHLAIVLITHEEKEKLDHELGLRDSMPEGWRWDGDIYARLHKAGIEYELYDEG